MSVAMVFRMCCRRIENVLTRGTSAARAFPRMPKDSIDRLAQAPAGPGRHIGSAMVGGDALAPPPSRPQKGAMPMRVLIITERYPPQIGGVAVSTCRIAGSLAAAGHCVHVLNLRADLEACLVQSGPEDAVMVHRVGVRPGDDMALQLVGNIICDLHERVGFDILHGHYLTPPGYLAAFHAQFLGTRSLVSVRGNDVDRGMFVGTQLPFVRWTLEHADAIGCVSRELVHKCRVLSGREDVRYTPNSVDAEVFRPLPPDPALARSFGIDGHTVLGFVGELRFKKGTLHVLEAFRQVRQSGPCKLLLVGGLRGPDRSALRLYLRQHPELRDDLHVVEYIQDREELIRHYNLMDLVLQPSLWDGMPNSVLEAMACARPVLASSAGGIRDIVTHGETGLLISPHELQRLGEGCLEALELGEAELRRMAAAARDYVSAAHRPQQELERLTELYRGGRAARGG